MANQCRAASSSARRSSRSRWAHVSTAMTVPYPHRRRWALRRGRDDQPGVVGDGVDDPRVAVVATTGTPRNARPSSSAVRAAPMVNARICVEPQAAHRGAGSTRAAPPTRHRLVRGHGEWAVARPAPRVGTARGTGQRRQVTAAGTLMSTGRPASRADRASRNANSGTRASRTSGRCRRRGSPRRVPARAETAAGRRPGRRPGRASIRR